MRDPLTSGGLPLRFFCSFRINAVASFNVRRGFPLGAEIGIKGARP
jgi:hypothetical protein